MVKKLKLLTINNLRLIQCKLIQKSACSTRILILTISLFLAFSQNTVFSGDINGSVPSDVKKPHILVLCSYGYSLPAYSRMNSALLSELEQEGIDPDDIFFEFLDLGHIQDKGERVALAELLERKYSSLGVDLIICLHSPAIKFMLEEAAGRFPGIPVITWRTMISAHRLVEKAGFLSLAGNMDINNTITNALALFPQTREILFVIGDSPMDRDILDEARESFANWESRLVIKDTSTESFEQILKNVARMPPDSIIIFGNFFQDISGRTFTPRDVGRKIAKAANVPVFALYDTMLDQGIVGGTMLSFEAEGTRIGQRALDIIEGRITPSSQSPVQIGNAVSIYDWKQIERWNGKAGQLPPDSTFINYSLSSWEHYRWVIISSITFVIIEFLLILALLIQQRRRSRAEEKLQAALTKAEEGDRILSALMEYVPEGITISDSDLNLIRVSRYGMELLGGLHQGRSLDEVVAQWKVYEPDGRKPMADEKIPLVRAVRNGEVIKNFELMEADSSGNKLSLLCNAAPIHDSAGEVIGGIVAWSDITDRKKDEEALKASLAEKDILLKEVHHRVKNNMQVISSLISLQAKQSQDSIIQEALRDVSYRVHSMAVVHEKLYQAEDLSSIDFAQYAESLISYLWHSYGSRTTHISLKKEFEQVLLPIDKAVPLGLILNELINNALKHAFPEHVNCEVKVILKKHNQKGVLLSVLDNGKGLPAGLDLKEADSLGLRL